jgi:uncharacterized membrane protein
VSPDAGGVAVDLALRTDDRAEGGGDDDPDGEVGLQAEVDHRGWSLIVNGHDRARRGVVRGASCGTPTAGGAMAAHRYTHPVNQSMFDDAPRGARIADQVTGFMGSWTFIVIQTVIVVAWISGNLFLLSQPFDPAPFILLNLAFSTQAAYAAPLILLAGNRQALRDRLTLEHTASEADLEEEQNKKLLAGNTEILKQIESLEERILQLESSILGRLDKQG